MLPVRTEDKVNTGMNKLVISCILSGLIEQYFHSAVEGGRDCRLLVPGLTKKIGKQVHRCLIEKGIKSYLVIGSEEKPNESEHMLRAVGLTSKRIGSFVAIVNPGQLAHIQDSIRGSGGTIRSLTFSEEWPWIDDGSEPFRFDGPVLEALIQFWSGDPEKQNWFREFVIKGLLEYTRSNSRRAKILLEDIIGSFDPTKYPEITDVRQKLLYYAGVPRFFGQTPEVQKVIQQTLRLCKKIVNHCQKEMDARKNARGMIEEIVEVDERDNIKASLDTFLDGIGESTTLDLGILAFHGCWGTDRSNTIHWRRLHAERLTDLFGVRERQKAEVSYVIECPRGIIAEDGKKLATFVGELVNLTVRYRIPEDQFISGQWMIRILNRQRITKEQQINEFEGEVQLEFDTAACATNFSRKLPIRIALVNDNDVEAYDRLELNLCGEDRQAFAVVDPDFEVIDASPENEEEIPDKKITVDRPVHVYLFSHAENNVGLSDENDDEIDLIKTEVPGIWRSTQRTDVSNIPSGIAIRICRFGTFIAVLCFEAGDIEKGEYTLEDEIRIAISGGSEKRLKDLTDLFEGKSTEPYPALGQIDDSSRRRSTLAQFMTNPRGWRPLLTNLLVPDHKSSGSLGDFIQYFGRVEGEAFKTLTFSDEALSLLKDYSNTRDAIRQEIDSFLSTSSTIIEHPMYASHPVFVHQKAAQMESLLKGYLDVYRKILVYADDKQDGLEWSQLFVLTHLDCVVHWDNSRLRNAIYLIGPWHPLVLAKRFMVQAALFSRAYRVLKVKDGKTFRHLSFLLGGVQGFRWGLGMSADDRLIEPTHVIVTSDPGWHLALKKNTPELAAKELYGALSDITDVLRQNYGIVVMVGTGSNKTLAVTCLSSYLRAFPSRRSIGIRVRRGYEDSDILRNIDDYIHTDEGATEIGKQLPGGIRLYFEEQIKSEIDARWIDPPLYVYRFEDDEECLAETFPDIYMLPPVNEFSFKSANKKHHLPRGAGREAVFSKRLEWLTEGQFQIPKSIAYECDIPKEQGDNFGGAFNNVICQIGSIAGKHITTVCTVDLPQRLSSPWAVIPGYSIDPAILVKYVRDGADREIQDRALWDYKLDVTGKGNSYFVLSTIPKGYEVAVNGFFEREDIARDFIAELGRIGIAIGGEALKSGRHALGVIGLIGAVRLLVGKTSNGLTPINCSANMAGFLLPVDSFTSFFGKGGPVEGKRTDLLAVQLVLPESENCKIRISACGVESKLVSKKYGLELARLALEQAKTTGDEFKALVETSLKQGAMPERLALLEMLKFGLRITSPSKPSKIDNWINIERVIYNAVLQGNYEYLDAKYNGLLVSTEGGLRGVAEHIVMGEGLWVRLTKGHWPGISDTLQLENIRQVLCKLFKIPVNSSLSPILKPESPPLAAPTQPEEKQNAVPDVPYIIEEEGNVTDSSVESQEVTQSADVSSGKKTDALIDRILIGVDQNRSEIYFDPQSPVDPLDNMNVMVTGSSGTGKTQFLKYLICQIRDQDKNVLVLDMKNDFASDENFCERARLDRIFVAFDGLPLNPLIPYPVPHPQSGELFIQCAQYIAGVSSVLKRTYGLGVQQQAAVKNAIVSAFTTAGITTTGYFPYTDDLSFPDFSNVGDYLEDDNPNAFNRLDPLFTLGLFRPEFRSQSFHGLVNKAAILDLSQIPSDEIKNALAQLIVLTSHAYYNAQPHSGYIRQFLIFDEGHRVLSSEYMLRLVRECRAYGVGTILSSQYPSDFPSDISASMFTKIVHGNGRDAERVKEIVQLLGCGGKEGDIASLGRFQAFVDNRHYPHTLLRTMNYPLYLVWAKLKELGEAARNELSQAEGLDTTKLPIGNLLQQLEIMGLAEEREGRVFIL